jgi:hypothetical protein
MLLVRFITLFLTLLKNLFELDLFLFVHDAITTLKVKSSHGSLLGIFVTIRAYVLAHF